MVQVSYPGVYIQEVPSGVRTITGVATSVGAFVDAFTRGPLDEAVQLLSYADFEREFGGLNTHSPASYGIRQFFQNGGGECWAVRVAEGSVGTATATLKDEAGNDVLRARAGRQIRGATALDPGAWGNGLLLDVDYDCADPATQFNLTVTEVATSNGQRVVRATEVHRNLGMDAALPNYAPAVVNAASRLVQLDRDAIAGAPARPVLGGTYGAVVGVIPGSPIDLTVDVGGGAVAIPVSHSGSVDAVALRALLEAAIRAAAANVAVTTDAQRQLLAGASVRLLGTDAASHRFWVRAGRGGNAYAPSATLVIGGAGAPALGFPVAPPVTARAQQFELTGGADGTLPVGAAALTGSLAGKTGVYALEDVDLFNILCIPRAAELGGTDMRAVYEEASGYASSRRAFTLVDIPEATASLDAMQTWATDNDTLRSRDAAVYFPRTLCPDPINANRLRSLAASGTVAGLYARTDAARGVWKAPAGTDAALQNVQALAYNLTDAQNGVLNPLGINCLRSFPVYGSVCWGARTLHGADLLASEWKYIPIRRLALFIEESLYRGTKWVVFEPNDLPLYAQIRLNVGSFMNGLFRQGAFQGKTPQEAYFVKCDGETTTQADRNLGIVNIVVGFAPLKPAEFVVIKIQQIAGDLQ